jgi:hypothetical protein
MMRVSGEVIPATIPAIYSDSNGQCRLLPDANPLLLLGFTSGIGQSRTLPDADDAFRSSKAFQGHLLDYISPCCHLLEILSGNLSFLQNYFWKNCLKFRRIMMNFAAILGNWVWLLRRVNY